LSTTFHSKLVRIGFGLLALGVSSCVNLSMTKRHAFRGPTAAEVDGLTIGTVTMADCLETLGAPLAVEEYFGGAALAYGGADTENWGISLSIPIDQDSASLSYNDIEVRTDGLLLLFDEQLVLKSVRRGNLRELLESPERRRSNSVDE